MTDQVMETVEDSITAEYIATNQLDILEANNNKLPLYYRTLLQKVILLLNQ